MNNSISDILDLFNISYDSKERSDIIEILKNYFLHREPKYVGKWDDDKFASSTYSESGLYLLLSCLETDDDDIIHKHIITIISDLYKNLSDITLDVLTYLYKNNYVDIDCILNYYKYYIEFDIRIYCYHTRLFVDNNKVPSDYLERCIVAMGVIDPYLYNAAYILYNYVNGFINLNNTFDKELYLGCGYFIENYKKDTFSVRYVIETIFDHINDPKIYSHLLQHPAIIQDIGIFTKVFDKCIESRAKIDFRFLDNTYDVDFRHIRTNIYNIIVDKLIDISSELLITFGIFNTIIDMPNRKNIFDIMLCNTNLKYDLTYILSEYRSRAFEGDQELSPDRIKYVVKEIIYSGLLNEKNKLIIDDSVIGDPYDMHMQISLLEVCASCEHIKYDFVALSQDCTYEEADDFYNFCKSHNIPFVTYTDLSYFIGCGSDYIHDMVSWRIDVKEKYNMEFKLTPYFVDYLVRKSEKSPEFKATLEILIDKNIINSNTYEIII